MKELYSENYKTFMKDTSKWNSIHVHGLEGFYFLNVHTPNSICRFNIIPLKILVALFTKVENNPKVYMEPKKTSNNQSNSEKKQSRVKYRERVISLDGKREGSLEGLKPR